MPSSDARTVRIFLSSTFRDFGEERDLLVRRVFPSLRARLKERFVELVDVDLRWGITAEQAERGEVLPICLAEIDRSRPFFVGLLGERYGWVPPADAYASDLLERQPWLNDQRGGCSVTELEILHGVLNNPKMAGRALFYFRSAAYAQKKGSEYLPVSEENAGRQKDLKDRIRRSGFPVVEDYATPEAFAERLEADLWMILDEIYPADEVPDAFERESRRHEAYAAPRRRLYLGGERYGLALDEALSQNAQRVLIEGQSGGGKSALIANWLEQHSRSQPQDLIHVHYTVASADASDPVSLVRRLLEAIKRTTGSSEGIPGDPQTVLESLPLWLANASAYASKEQTRWVLVFDAFNGLQGLRDLRWFPEFLPERVHIIISCLPGEVLEQLTQKGDWRRILVEPLDRTEAQVLLTRYLAGYNKTLPSDLTAQVLSHPLATNPLFLRTLAEELRLFGVHEELAQRLEYYLASQTVDDLFERVLARVEGDCGADVVRTTMEGIWASRAGLAEEEILAFANLVPATWAPIRYALDEALLESGGRITFAHDYLRIAVSDRYMAGNNALAEESQTEGAKVLRRRVHTRLAQWFETRPVDERAAEEIPYQWQRAQDWENLKACLTRKDMFEAIYANRSNEELLSYWLDLEREANADLESDYERAWAQWDLDQEAETGNLAAELLMFLLYAGRYQGFTERLARLALVIAEKAQGPEHPDTGKRLNNLAGLLQCRGDYAAAEPLYRRALAIAEKAQGPEHLDMSELLNNFATLLHAMGDYAAAEPLHRRALAIAEKAQGPEHPDTGNRLNNLALLLHDMGDYAAAEPLYRRALVIAETAQGPEHPVTATSLNNLAGLLEDKGDYAAAEPLYRRALTIAEKAEGPEHPHTGLALHNLAGLLRAKGDYGAAEPLYRRALTIAEKAKGPEHPDTGRNLGNLAVLLMAKGDYGAAEPLLRRALAIAEKALGPKHPDTGASLNVLATLLHDKGDYAAAEPLYRRALVIAETAQGPEHPVTATSLNNLAGLLEDKGDYAAAEPLYRRALTIAEKAEGPEHPDTGRNLGNLAVLLVAKGDYGAAEPLLRRALAIAEKAQGPEHPDTGKRLNNLAGLLEDKGDYAAAEPLYRRALAIAEKAQGPEHAVTTTFSANLEGLLTKMGRKPQHDLLLSRGDFVSAVAQAKALAAGNNIVSLTPLAFLGGAVMAGHQDPNWGDLISAAIGEEAEKKIRLAADAAGLNLDATYKTVELQMPVSDDLKLAIGVCSRKPFSDLVQKLLDLITSDGNLPRS